MTGNGRNEASKPIGILLLRSRCLQTLHRIPDVGVKPRATSVEMRQDRGAHARIPEFPDMLGDAWHRLALSWLSKNFPIWLAM
jgi:hypothetical protein